MRAATNEVNWNIVGHDWAVATLAHHVCAGREQHAYLFTGASGVGKRTLAVAFARELLCAAANTLCADSKKCRACTLIVEGKHPDVRMLAPVTTGKVIKSAKIGVERVRELVRHFSLRPVEAKRRIAILTNFELAGRAASDTLLKTLEEPPGNGIIIITAASSADLPPTIVSRCGQIPLRPLPRSLVQRALCKRWGASSEQADILARLSGGRLGRAVGLLNDESGLVSRSARLSELPALLQASRVDRLSYADRLRKDRGDLVAVLDLWGCWWRDVMHVAAGATTSITNTDRIAELAFVADRLTAADAAHAINSVRDAQRRLQSNANPRLALEVLLLDLPRISAT